ncbi:uncharacterized protein LOC116849222 [Odontomachus brunneus]|uniref:uncharacterized protein LOC116849222 n=1 Tax=Odontomachus brunneus TaxID=486640 RepID=UPI0013F1A010|nr:uncharacterized protein LOC116849222 [Odontomachus brunneus]
MESFGVLLNVLCCFAILAGPMMVLSAPSTTEIPRADAARPSVESSKSKDTEKDPDCPWIHVARAEDAVQADKELSRNSSRSEEESAQDARRSKHTGDRRGDGFRLSYQRGPAVDLPSHDTTLPDSGAISARQAKRSTGDYRDYPASSSVTSGDDVARRSIDSSRQRGSGFKDDLGIAEYRFPPQNPYWYQRQYSNQRYRPNDRRDPYRNYLRYPVFPGR